MKRTEIIAEVGQAHDGSVGILHALIDAIAPSGVDAIKFQVHIAAAESSIHEPFRVQFSRVDKTRFEYWKRMELTKDQWLEVKEHCEAVGVAFLASPFSCAAVDLLEAVGIRRYKIGSGELSNYLMLEKIARTGKPIILSSGMSSFSQIEGAVAFLSEFQNKVSILQCTTEYPTAPESLGLNVIGELRSRFGIPIGFSDHSGTVYAGLAAAALGADIIEVHVTFDKRMFGPDAAASLTVAELEDLVRGVRYIDQALSHPIDKSLPSVPESLKAMFGKSLTVNRRMDKGERIEMQDLEAKKPSGLGVPAEEFQRVIGRVLSMSKGKYDFLTEDDLG